jgi:predicted ATPase
MRTIAITGGPGAGKTSLVLRLLQAFPEQLVVVPEVATLLLRHFFPPVQGEHERRAFQRAIFAVQRNLEDAYSGRLGRGQVLLCDRGTPDGGGYWPEGHDAFFAAMGTARHAELARYDAVLFLETAAKGGLSIADGNETRSEDLSQALAVDRRLQDVWSGHGSLAFVPQQPSFADKLDQGVDVVSRWLAALSP